MEVIVLIVGIAILFALGVWLGPPRTRDNQGWPEEDAGNGVDSIRDKE